MNRRTMLIGGGVVVLAAAAILMVVLFTQGNIPGAGLTISEAWVRAANVGQADAMDGDSMDADDEAMDSESDMDSEMDNDESEADDGAMDDDSMDGEMAEDSMAGDSMDGGMAGMQRSGVSAAYLIIENGGGVDDRLINVITDVAGVVEIHETVVENEIARMQPLTDGLLIPAGETVHLEPGGYHIMLMDLQQDLVEGETVPLLLEFISGVQVSVDALVRTEAPPAAE